MGRAVSCPGATLALAAAALNDVPLAVTANRVLVPRSAAIPAHLRTLLRRLSSSRSQSSSTWPRSLTATPARRRAGRRPH